MGNYCSSAPAGPLWGTKTSSLSPAYRRGPLWEGMTWWHDMTTYDDDTLCWQAMLVCYAGHPMLLRWQWHPLMLSYDNMLCCVMITWCDDMLWWQAMLICYKNMLCWQAMLICYDNMRWWHVMTKCSDDLLWWHALIICYNDMLWRHATTT